MDAMTYASLKVIIDGQAYLYAMLNLGSEVEKEDFQACMDQYKEDTGDLINGVLEGLVEEAAKQEEANEQE